MISRLLHLSLFIFTLSLHSSSASSLHRRSNCGNGVLDPGEQCDYAISSSQGCCSTNCKILPALFTTCASGHGVCDTTGTCQSQSSLCSSFNGKVLSVDSSLALNGPFVPCDSTTNQPIFSSSCKLSCAGENLTNHSNVCLDLSQYSNIANIMPNGASCASGNTPGICFNGNCDTQSCEQYRCNNRGSCNLNSNNTISCTCEQGYSGSDCSITPSCSGKVDSCGVCNGDNTSCGACSPNGNCTFQPGKISFWKSALFTNIIVPVVVSVIVLIILISAFVIIRRRKSKKKPSFSVFHSQSPTSSAHSHSSSSVTSPLQQASLKKQAQMGISVKFDEFKCIANYDPVLPDEIELKLGDILFKLFEYDDGWAKGYNTRTGAEGVYPVGFTERVVS